MRTRVHNIGAGRSHSAEGRAGSALLQPGFPVPMRGPNSVFPSSSCHWCSQACAGGRLAGSSRHYSDQQCCSDQPAGPGRAPAERRERLRSKDALVLGADKGVALGATRHWSAGPPPAAAAAGALCARRRSLSDGAHCIRRRRTTSLFSGDYLSPCQLHVSCPAVEQDTEAPSTSGRGVLGGAHARIRPASKGPRCGQQPAQTLNC